MVEGDKFLEPTGFVAEKDLPPLSEEDRDLLRRTGFLHPRDELHGRARTERGLNLQAEADAAKKKK